MFSALINHIHILRFFGSTDSYTPVLATDTRLLRKKNDTGTEETQIQINVKSNEHKLIKNVVLLSL